MIPGVPATFRLLQFAFGAVAAHPYVGIFALQLLGLAGLAPPEEVTLVCAGYLSFRGRAFGPVLAATSACGLILCDLAIFFLGRLAGRRRAIPLLRRLWPPEKFRAFFARHGARMIFFGRWFVGIRPALFFSAGLSGLSWKRVALADAPAALWSTLFWFGAGQLFGPSIEKLVEVIGPLELILAAAAGGFALAFVARAWLAAGRRADRASRGPELLPVRLWRRGRPPSPARGTEPAAPGGHRGLLSAPFRYRARESG
jgi:membrane protein DedA with SNARE-associated domain